MRPFTPLPKHTEQRMRTLLKQATSTWEYRRIQCVLLRASLQLPAERVGPMVGLHPASVWRIWSQYLAEGEKAILGEKRGGRYKAHLTTDEESTLLRPFLKRAERGELVTIRMVHEAVCRKVGHPVDPSTTYRMLHRSHWRKVVPRPHHPRAVTEEQERFKALFPPGVGRGKGAS